MWPDEQLWTGGILGREKQIGHCRMAIALSSKLAIVEISILKKKFDLDFQLASVNTCAIEIDHKIYGNPIHSSSGRSSWLILLHTLAKSVAGASEEALVIGSSSYTSLESISSYT